MNARRLRNPFRFDPWHLPLGERRRAAGAPSPVFREFVGHPRKDAFWERRDLSRGRRCRAGPPLERLVRRPARRLASRLAGRCGAARRRRRRRGAAARDRTDRPRADPLSSGRVGRIEVGRDALVVRPGAALLRLLAARARNGVEHDPAVQVYVVGADRWRTADTWPLPGTEFTRLYLHSRGRARRAEGGELSRETPGDESSDSFSYDPDVLRLRTGWAAACGTLASELDDRRPVEVAPDVLVYSTPALTTDLEVVGPLVGDAVRLVVGAGHRLHRGARRCVPRRLRAARAGRHRAVAVWSDGHDGTPRASDERLATSVITTSTCAPPAICSPPGTACASRYRAATSGATTAT